MLNVCDAGDPLPYITRSASVRPCKCVCSNMTTHICWLVRCFRSEDPLPVLPDLLKYCGDESGTGADDLLPYLIFTILILSPHHMHSNIRWVEGVVGEGGGGEYMPQFSLTTFIYR